MSNRSIHPNILLAALTGLNLFNYLDRYVLAAVLTPMKESLGLTDNELGLVSTIFMIGYFVSSPFFGYWGDRMSRKWLIAAGVFVWSLGTVLTSTAGGLIALLVYRVLVGFGEASYGSISPTVIADAFPPAKRNNAITIFFVAIPCGSALGYLLGGFIAALPGHTWRDAFLYAGLPGLFLALLLLPFAEPKRGGSDASAAAHVLPKPADVLKLFKIRNYNLIILGYIAYTFSMGAYAFWGPTFLVRFHGLSNQFANTFFGGTLVVAGLVGTLVGGFLATRWHRRFQSAYAWVCGLGVLFAAPLTTMAFVSSDKTIVMVSLALAMFCLFLSTGPINTLILEASPFNLRSTGMALSIFCIHLFGDVWSPQIVGLLSDRWGNLSWALMILPGAFLVAGGFWIKLALEQQRHIVPQLSRS